MGTRIRSLSSGIRARSLVDLGWKAPWEGVPTGFEAGDVVFRPGVASSPPFYATWAEVEAIAAGRQGGLQVFVDTCRAPAIVTGATDGLGRLAILAFGDVP